MDPRARGWLVIAVLAVAIGLTLAAGASRQYGQIGDKWRVARVVGWVGLAAVWSGDEYDLAEGLLKEALALDRELGNVRVRL